MASEVGSGQVAIVPVFKGFRRALTTEVEGSAKTASTGFQKLFARSAADTGRSSGAGFKKAFEQSSSGVATRASQDLQRAVAKAAAALSAARLKEQDATGKARVAEAQLAEARRKYAADSSQVIRAEERLATVTRELQRAQERTEESTDDLKKSQLQLADAAETAANDLTAAGRRGGQGFRQNAVDGFRSTADGIRSAAPQILAVIATLGIGKAIGDAFRVGLDFLRLSVVEASSLTESGNAVRVSFGEAAAEVAQLGLSAAQRLGLSRVEFASFATRFSAFASTIRSDDVPGFIDEITTRGADFASVFNLQVSDALDLFQSGLAGETEPLRRFGIDLSAATVEAFAYANGIGVAGTELTETQKQQARYGALLAQTSKVQGDFSNTSGELANQQRILQAEYANSQAKLGTALLPALTTLANLANETLIPALNDVISQVGPELGASLSEAVPEVADLVLALVPLLPQLVSLATNGLPPLIDLLTIISPLLVDWATNQAQVAKTVTGFFDLLNGDTSFQKFSGEILKGGGSVFEFARTVGTAVAQVLSALTSFRSGVNTNVTSAVATVRGLPTQIRGVFAGAGQWLVQAGRDLVNGLVEGVRSMASRAVDAARDLGSNMLSGIKDFLGIRSPSRVFRQQVGQQVGEGMILGIRDKVAGVRSATESLAFVPGVTSSGLQAASSGMPSELVVIDADGALIGRMRVEARGETRRYDRAQTREQQMGWRD